jgi:hypothetical protein
MGALVAVGGFSATGVLGFEPLGALVGAAVGSVVAGLVGAAGRGANAALMGPIRRIATISRISAGKISCRHVTGTSVDFSESSSPCPWSS